MAAHHNAAHRNRGSSVKLQYTALFLLLAMAVLFQFRASVDVMVGLKGEESIPRPILIVRGGSNVIDRPLPHGTSAGLKSGDRILEIDGVPFVGFKQLYTNEATIHAVRESDGASQPITVRLKRTNRPSPIGATADFLYSLFLPGIMPWICLVLGFWVAFVRPRDPQAWLLLSVMLSFPHLIDVGQRGHWEDGLRQFSTVWRSLMLGIFPGAMAFFGVYFGERWSFDRKLPWLKWLIAIPSLAAAVIAAAHSVAQLENFDLARSLQPVAPYAALTPNLMTPFGIGFFFLAMGWKGTATENPDVRRRLRLLLWGAQIALGPLGLVLLIGLIRGVPPFRAVPFGVFLLALSFFLLFPLTLVYVIIVHRAMDVRVAVRQGIQYAFVRGGAAVFFVLVGIAILLSAILYSQSANLNRPNQIKVIAFGVLALFLLQRLRIQIARWIDKRFFRDAYDAERILSDLGEEVRTIVDPSKLAGTVGARIAQSLHIPRVAFLLAGDQGFRPAFALGYDRPPEVSFQSSAALIKQLTTAHDPVQIYFDDEDSWVYNTPDLTDAERENLRRLESQLILPLAVKEKLLGFISLSQKRSEEPYSGTDLRLLRSLASQTGLALENSRLTAAFAKEAAQRERLNREVEIAREVQERLFPQKIPKIQGLDCAGGCRPALGVGGDYYDFLVLPNDRLGVVIGDVAGKGIGAALLMASLQASVRAQALYAGRDVASLISQVNSLVYESSASNRYATLFYAQIDTKTLELDYVNAGHNPPLLLRKCADGLQVQHLDVGGTVVGLLPRFDYKQGTIQLQPGDLLVAFTDGISEAMNSRDEEWGEDNLIQAAGGAGNLSAPELIPVIVDAADKFAAGAPQHDDMTLVIVRVGEKTPAV